MVIDYISNLSISRVEEETEDDIFRKPTKGLIMVTIAIKSGSSFDIHFLKYRSGGIRNLDVNNVGNMQSGS